MDTPKACSGRGDWSTRAPHSARSAIGQPISPPGEHPGAFSRRMRSSGSQSSTCIGRPKRSTSSPETGWPGPLGYSNLVGCSGMMAFAFRLAAGARPSRGLSRRHPPAATHAMRCSRQDIASWKHSTKLCAYVGGARVTVSLQGPEPTGTLAARAGVQQLLGGGAPMGLLIAGRVTRSPCQGFHQTLECGADHSRQPTCAVA